MGPQGASGALLASWDVHHGQMYQQVEEPIMGQARDKIDALKNMVTQAERSGSLNATLARAFWDIVGDRPDSIPARSAAPVDREVTIRLRVSGASAIPREAASEVERALSGVASRAGITVTPGSVSIS